MNRINSQAGREIMERESSAQEQSKYMYCIPLEHNFFTEEQTKKVKQIVGN